MPCCCLIFENILHLANYIDFIKEKENGNNQESNPNKRGRGSERQAKVLVMVESEPSISTPIKDNPNRKMGYLKMVVMEDLKSESINKEIVKSVDKTASGLSDGYTGYAILKEVITNHYVVVELNKQNSAKIFPGYTEQSVMLKKYF